MTPKVEILVDTHCHLNLTEFEKDLFSVLQRAASQGVTRFLVPGIDVRSSRAAIGLAERHPCVLAAVGVHPNRADEWEDGVADEIRHLARSQRVVAIGEIGLDYYRHSVPRAKQLEAFRGQLDLAFRLELPVVVHNRDAGRDLMRELLEWEGRNSGKLAGRAGVLHAFSGNLEMAREAVAAGFFLGIGGPLTYRNSQGLREIVTKVDIGRLVLETDAPYLTPHPYRGERNEPAYVSLVAEELATLQGMSQPQIAHLTSHNADTLFAWNHGSNDGKLP